ncbi:MAG TPA: hypothetical protein VF469_10850 [Kofleriaceae bacterium]
MSTRTIVLSPAEEAARLPPQPSEARPRPRTVPPPLSTFSIEPDPHPDAWCRDAIRVLTELEPVLVQAEAETSVAAKIIGEGPWPAGGAEDVEYRRNLLCIGHMVGTSQQAHRTALAQVRQLLARSEKQPPVVSAPRR